MQANGNLFELDFELWVSKSNTTGFVLSLNSYSILYSSYASRSLSRIYTAALWGESTLIPGP